MADLLADALRLTLWGMGMTFVSLGALVGGMFLLTWVTRSQTDGRRQTRRRTGDGERPQTDGGEGGLEGDAPVVDGGGRVDLAVQPELVTGDDAEGRRRAAAAAVAVAWALQARGRGRAVLPPAGGGVRGERGWDVYARGLRLAGRARYEALRGRRGG